MSPARQRVFNMPVVAPFRQPKYNEKSRLVRVAPALGYIKAACKRQVP